MSCKILLVAVSVVCLSIGGLPGVRLRLSNIERDASNSNSSPYILGGELVQGREFPGMASVNLFGYHYCGGSIINSEWVLTTASCMSFNPGAYYVQVGTNQLDNGGTSHTLKELILHEAYNISDSWINDIALIKVQPPIQFGEGLAPVNLPEKGLEIPVGTTGTVAGWGAVEIMGPIVNDLHKVDINIYDKEKCQEAYAPIDKHIYPNQECAASEEGGKGPMFGDGAAPFIVDGKIIGLMSWERNVNEKGYPAVMTKVSAYIDWINGHISG